jgi:hypothetical protein
LTESTSAIRRLPKYGRSKYNSSIRRINARFSAAELARTFPAERGLPTVRPELEYKAVGQGRHCPCEVPAPPHAGFLFGVHAFKSDGRDAPLAVMADARDPSIQELVEKLDEFRRRHIELANQRKELRRQCDEIVAQRDEIAEQLQWAREQESLSGMRRVPK